MSSILHEIFADNAQEYIKECHPAYPQLKVLNHINSCRTPALGAAVYDCACGERSLVYHSCRDRHCPVCQGMNNARWADKQIAASLPIKYYHIVFTLPESLNGFVLANQKASYDALFESASSALLKLCADKRHLGAVPGFTAVLHTWGQTMQFHPHLHVIITAGGLADKGMRFIDKSDTNYLLPVKVLSKLFRGIFIDLLTANASLDASTVRSLYKTDFFCYLKEPMERADNAVKYLARYAHRVCISDKRIISYDKSAKTVTFTYKDNKDGGKQKEMTLTAKEFIRRFLLHVLPKRFMKIRHYGILNNRGKYDRIKRCRRLLNASAQPPAPWHTRRCFICPACGKTVSQPSHFNALQLNFVLRC